MKYKWNKARDKLKQYYKQIFHKHACKKKAPTSDPQDVWVIAGNSTQNVL